MRWHKHGSSREQVSSHDSDSILMKVQLCLYEYFIPSLVSIALCFQTEGIARLLDWHRCPALPPLLLVTRRSLTVTQASGWGSRPCAPDMQEGPRCIEGHPETLPGVGSSEGVGPRLTMAGTLLDGASRSGC